MVRCLNAVANCHAAIAFSVALNLAEKFLDVVFHGALRLANDIGVPAKDTEYSMGDH